MLVADHLDWNLIEASVGRGRFHRRTALDRSPVVQELLTGRLSFYWAPTRVLSDDPTKGLGRAADDALAWRASVLANLAPDASDVHAPETLPRTGRALLAEIALAGAAGLSAVDQVTPSAIDAAAA